MSFMRDLAYQGWVLMRDRARGWYERSGSSGLGSYERNPCIEEQRLTTGLDCYKRQGLLHGSGIGIGVAQ